MIGFLFIFFSFLAYPQEFQYKIEGSFQTRAVSNLGQPLTVTYSITWNETTSEIQGLYNDNYFSLSSPRFISGEISSEGRNFKLIFPTPTQNIKQLSLTTSQNQPVTGTIPLTITTKNEIGGIVDKIQSIAILTVLPVSLESGGPNNDQDCIVGFGSLTGLCGLYGGTFHEISDARNRCDFLGGNNPRLELSSDTIFRLILNYSPGIPDPLIHNIGAFLPSPTSNTISVTGKTCGPLPRTSFESGTCKTMNLSGIFSRLGNSVQFTGTYSISDDTNGDTCSYTLFLNREVVY